MHCFVHSAIPAVGICKYCGKGLCSQCAVDTGQGLACQGSCEEHVEVMARIIANNAKVISTANAQTRSAALLGIVMGVLFLGFGGIAYMGGINFAAMMFGAMGALFLGHGLVRLTTERYPDPK